MSDSVRGRHVIVAGAGVSGRGCAAILSRLGARVTVVDGRAAALEEISAKIPAVHMQSVDAATADLRSKAADRPDLVVTSPGWRPDSPLLVAYMDAGIEVIGDVELAWRLDQAGEFGSPRRWLAVTGTNGKTTTTGMLAEIMRADAQVTGRRAEAAGNIGRSVFDVLADADRVDTLVVELSSFQLHWSTTLAPTVGVLLNLAGDHLDWHGSFADYAAAKAKALTGNVGVIGRDDPEVRRVAKQLADSGQLANHRVSFTLSEPDLGEVGIADGRLIDNAVQAAAGNLTAGSLPVDLGSAEGIEPPGDAGLADAAAAAAAARAAGALPESVVAGLSHYTVSGHRGAHVAAAAGVEFIDNSKATNPHAADAALSGAESVVWIAGGQLKDTDVSGVIAKHRHRLRAAVIIGQDRTIFAEALAHSAPGVPVEVVDDTAPRDAMETAVRVARRHAEPGDIVLLAPAAASLDMYSGMAERGDAFAAAVMAQIAQEN